MAKWFNVLMLSSSLAFMLNASNIKNSDMLISADEAVKLIGKEGVVFVTGDDETAFEGGHIEGSVEMYAHHLHHSDITGKMHCAPLFMCPKEAEEYIGKHGISNDTLIIAYDNFRGPNATGVLEFFRSWGHKKIKLLDGGRDAIKAIDPVQQKYDKLRAKRKELKKELKVVKKEKNDKKAEELKKEIKSIKTQMNELKKDLLVQLGKAKHHPKKTTYKIDLDKINYDLIAGKDEIKHAVEDILKNGDNSKYIIIDTRGTTEIIGERKMDNVARGGHIPGAKFIEWKNITDFDNKLSFKSLKQMQELFDKYGVTKDKIIYAYCHVGAGRSTHITTALRLLGYKNVKEYTGSWDEWGNDMNLPIRR